jgi:hypothetical protein
MFNDSKYTTWYNSIIAKAQMRDRSPNEYYERHHIVPKSMGGTQKKSNLVELTAREHYVCHLLLQKMVTNKRDLYKMTSAFAYLQKTKKKYTQRYTSRLFEYHKKLHIKVLTERMTGPENPMYGKHHSKETLKRISETKTGVPANFSEEDRKRRSERMLTKNPNYDPVLQKRIIDGVSRIYSVTNPQGETFQVKNLAKFCRENDLPRSSLGEYGAYKDWKIEKLV